MTHLSPPRTRIAAALAHLLVSGVVALLAALLVFGLWYPGPYRYLSGGRDLFYLLICVDVALGPLLTLAVFDLSKGWRLLRRDLLVIGLVQLAALGYGLHTVFIVRPVAMVFEVDRFRVVSPEQIYLKELPLARLEYQSLSLSGPKLLGARQPAMGKESNTALFTALEGFDISQRPAFWQPYSESKTAAMMRARSALLLLKQYPARSADISKQLLQLNLGPDTAKFLPVIARGDWVAVLDTQGSVAGFIAIDGFF